MASGGGPAKYNIRLCRITKWPNVPSIGFSMDQQAKAPHVIGAIESNSPAAATGLRIGDAIIEVNGKDMSSSDYKKLQIAVGDAIRKSGKIELLVVDKLNYEAAKKEKLLKSKTAQVLTTPPTMPEDYANFPKNKPRTCEIRLGSQDTTFGFDLAPGPGNKGAVIQQINPNTPASRTTLHKFDRIIEINDEFVDETPYSEIRTRLGQAKTAGGLKLYVMDTDTHKYFKQNNMSLKSTGRDQQGQGNDDDESDDDGPGQTSSSKLYSNAPDDSEDDDDDDRTASTQGGASAASSPMDIRECTITKSDPKQTFGFSLDFKQGEYPVLTVLRDGGQLKNPTTAGLKDGDRLVEINGKPTRGVPEDQLKQQIKNHPYPQPLVLLVADAATVNHYNTTRQPIHSRLPNIRRFPARSATVSSTDDQSAAKGGASLIGALVNNPLSGSRPSDQGLYENEDPSRVSQRAPAGQRTCLLRSSPDSKGMGFSFNNQEPDGTPHKVTVVTPNSPAARAGLKGNDIIISINDTNVERMTRDQVVQTVKGAINQEKSNGTPVKVVVREDVPPRPDSVASRQTVSRRTTHTDGQDTTSVSSLPLAPNQRVYVLRSSPDFEGLGINLNLSEPEGTPYRITVVKPNSPAQRENLRVGDTIVSINKKNIERLPRAEVKTLLLDAIAKEKSQRIPVTLVVIDQTAVPATKPDPQDSDDDVSSARTSRAPSRTKTPEQPKVQPGPNERLVSLRPDPVTRGIGIELDPRQQAGNPQRITRVKPLSAAANLGLRDGDTIVSINGKSVKNMSGDQIQLQLTAAIQRQIDTGNPVELIIENRPPTPISDDDDDDDDSNDRMIIPTTVDPRKLSNISVHSNTQPTTPSASAHLTRPQGTEVDHQSYRSETGGRYGIPREEDPYQRMKDVLDLSQTTTRSTRRDRTQVDLISNDQMYRVYHLHFKPGDSCGFEFDTEGDRHLVRRVQRGSDAEKKGLMENDQIVEVNGEKLLGKSEKSVKNALENARMNGHLVLMVYPQNIRALTKRSERSHSTVNPPNGKINNTLSSSMGDLTASTIRSYNDWNFDESPSRPLPNPSIDPSDPLPRACSLINDRSNAGCGFKLIESDKYDTPIVVEISPNSPARRSGLAVGDHIIYIDERNVQTLRTFKEKTDLIRRYFDQNNRVTLIVLTEAAYRVLHQRGGVLKSKPFDYQSNKLMSLRPRLLELILFDHEDDFGFTVYPISPTYVREVHGGSAAEENGLMKNDKILELNGETVSKLTARQMEKIIRDSRAERRITLLVIDPEGYDYSVRHAIPLHSDLPLVQQPQKQRTHLQQVYKNSVAL